MRDRSGAALPSAGAVTTGISRPYFLANSIVALILARGGHDRAGAIAHQDVVGDPDRHVFADEGISRISAGEDAGLFLGGREPFDLGLASRLSDVGLDLGALRQPW